MTSALRTLRARLATGLGLAIGLSSCTPDPVILPVRNLERPSDVAFACVQKVKPATAKAYLTARPMAACHDPVPKTDPTSSDAGGTAVVTAQAARKYQQTDESNEIVFGTFGFITNTARGEVAVAHLTAPAINKDELIDLDPSAPGYNHVPVGGLPEAIGVTDDGCRAVTANRGTCDLSVINVPAVLAKTFAVEQLDRQGTKPLAATQVRIDGLRAQPREIALLPQPSLAGVEASELRTDDDRYACKETSFHEAVVTFPSCSLVAIVEIPSGAALATVAAGGQVPVARIKSSVKLMPDGSVVDAGSHPVCPVECGFIAEAPEAGPAPEPIDAGAIETAPPPVVDAGVVDADAGDGGLGATEVAPRVPGLSGSSGGLALMPDGSAVFVGMAEAPYVVRIGVQGAGGARVLVPQGDAGTLTLAENAVGVARVRLSIDPYGAPSPETTGAEPWNIAGQWVGGRGRFLYAIARDASIRVIELDDSGAMSECEANVDPERLEPDYKSCYPLGSPRRLLADGPGIRVVATRDPDVPAAVPIDVAFAQVAGKAVAFVLASNASVFQIGLGGPIGKGADDKEETHWFRRTPPGVGNAGARPAVNVEPSRDFTRDPIERLQSGSTLPFVSKVTFSSPTAGPRLESYRTGVGTTSQVDNWVGFRVRSGGAVGATGASGAAILAPPSFGSLEWEGVLVGFPRVSGRLEVAGGAGEAGALSDTAANFCRLGVQTGDIVSLVGCDQDSSCDPLRDEVCHRAAPGAPGVCLPRKLAADEGFVRSCRSEFASRRRWQITDVSAHRLALGYKLDEVPRPAVAPCDPAAMPGSDTDVCQPRGTGHGPDSRVPGDAGFICKPFAQGQPRCVKPCERLNGAGVPEPDDSRCRVGHVCASTPEGFLCVEAPAPQAGCLPSDLRYAVQVGNGFHAYNDALPVFAKSIVDGDGGCQPLPNRDPRLQDRIPFTAPLCTEPAPADLNAFLTTSDPAPNNPCFLIGPNADETGGVSHVKAFYANPHYRLVLTNLESYVGDAGYLSFRVTDGFVPMRALATQSGVDVALGARIVTGPMAAVSVEGTSGNVAVPVPPYLFIIDQGRTTVDLSRGQLLRLNPRGGSSTPGGFFDSQNTDTRWPIQ